MSDNPMDCEIVKVENPAALEALNRSEIDIQISTAKHFPRSINRFQNEAKTFATIDTETAESCFYTLKRGNKAIMGESIRLAEIVGSSYGNLRYGSRTIEVGPTHITAQGTCFDMEKNIAVSVEVRRRITDKFGNRYNDDMIGVTANAATSIALRNAILRVVPRSLIKPIYDAAVKVAVGTAETLNERRASAIKYFNDLGVKTDSVLAVVGKAHIEDVGLSELAVLKGLATAIRDETTTIAEAFPVLVKEKSRTEGLVDKLKGAKEADEQPPEPEAETAPASQELPPEIQISELPTIEPGQLVCVTGCIDRIDTSMYAGAKVQQIKMTQGGANAYVYLDRATKPKDLKEGVVVTAFGVHLRPDEEARYYVAESVEAVK
jgi:hypothetical protein